MEDMHELSEIDFQHASTLVCDQMQCEACGWIDRDRDRMRKGHRCHVCDTESECERLAFSVNISVLVNLCQEAYFSQPKLTTPYSPQSANIAPILFFCTLRECLLNHFLQMHLRALNVPWPLIAKLLDDNKLANQKFGELFTSVTRVKWDEAVTTASAKASTNFKFVSELMRNAATIRNKFLHEGHAWKSTREFATECIDSLPQLTRLFVTLSNTYTHPLILERMRISTEPSEMD